MRATMTYLILSTPRSGSTLLGRGLESTNLAGRPREYFQPGGNFWSRHWHAASPTDYVDTLLSERATPNGVFGAKVHWRHLLEFERSVRGLPRFDQATLPDLLSELFPGLRYVRITRRDKLRQAISLLKASQTGVWGRSTAEDKAPSEVPEFDHDAINEILRMLLAHEGRIDGFFSQRRALPHTVVYEDFVDSYKETISATLAHLGIDAPKDLVVAAPRTARLADDETEEWVERYHRITQQQGQDPGLALGHER